MLNIELTASTVMIFVPFASSVFTRLYDANWSAYILIAFVVVILTQIFLKNRGLPPGPLGLPLFGYYFFLDPKPHLTLTELSKEYGKVFSLRSVGGTLFIILNGMEAIKEVLVERANEFIGRPLEMNIFKWLDDGYGITQSEGEAWKEQKRFFLTTAKTYGFGSTSIECYAHELIQEMIKDMREVKQGPVYLPSRLGYVSGNIISRILCNKPIPKCDEKHWKFTAGINDVLFFFGSKDAFLTGPILEHFVMRFLPHGQKIANTRKLLRDFTSDEVERHIRNLDPNHPKDFIDSYLLHLKNLEEKGSLENSTFSKVRLQNVFMGMFLEATESPTVVSLLVRLAKEPEAQKKAQKELDDVVGRDRLPSLMDKPNLPYFDALTLELFRTSAVFGISNYYSNFEETKLRGYRIPKRSFIIANLYSLNYDPSVFENPWKFDPGRFLNSEGKRMKCEVPWPFGVGKRSCTGEGLASKEIFLIISAVLQNFTLHPSDEESCVFLEERPKSLL